MKIFATVLVALVAVVLIGVVAVMQRMEALHRRSQNQGNKVVNSITPGTSLQSVIEKLGSPARTITNAAEIRLSGLATTREEIVTNSVLYLFVHKTAPRRWVCFYTRPDSQTVIEAGWKDR